MFRVYHAKCWAGEAQAGIKIAGRNINNLRYADNTTLMAESEELKSLLMKVKEESEKVVLYMEKPIQYCKVKKQNKKNVHTTPPQKNLNIHKTK